jgi:hypothetical protein
MSQLTIEMPKSSSGLPIIGFQFPESEKQFGPSGNIQRLFNDSGTELFGSDSSRHKVDH